MMETALTPPRRRHHNGDKLDDTDWLRHHYVTLNMTLAGIAERLGTHTRTVAAALRAAGIERRPGGGGNPVRYPQLRDPEFMVRRLVTERGTLAGVARELGCAEKTVREATQRDPNVAALRAAGWDQDANAAATRTGRPATSPPPPDEQLVAFIAAAGDATVQHVAAHFDLDDTATRRVYDTLARLVDTGQLERTGKKPVRYSTARTLAAR